MSDEPLYCSTCGREWGQDGCSCPEVTKEAPPREKRYCHVCGVIPEVGLECTFYDPPGRNKIGCNSVLKRESLETAHLPLFRLEISHPDWSGVAFADVRGDTIADAVERVRADLRQTTPPEDMARTLIKSTTPTALPAAIMAPIAFTRTFTICDHTWRNPSGFCLGCGDYIDTQRGES